MIDSEPSLPLRIGNGDGVSERAGERRQALREVGIFRRQLIQLRLSGAEPVISPIRWTTPSQWAI